MNALSVAVPSRVGWRVGRPAAPSGDAPRSARGTRHPDPQSAARARRGDAGNATVELALSLPALVLLVFAGLTAISAVRTEIECVDAAREAARAAARGEAAPASPPGAVVTVTTDGDLVRATVRVHQSPLGDRLPGFDIAGTSVAAKEPESVPSEPVPAQGVTWPSWAAVSGRGAGRVWWV